MEEGPTSSQWALIAREHTMRTLLERGEFTADDLAVLDMPQQYRRSVHGLVTAYFRGPEPFMEEAGRRKSARPERKGAKNDVFRISARGRRELPHVLRDLQSELAGLDAGGTPSPASVESGENIGAGQTMGKRDQGRSVTSPSASTDAPDDPGTAGLSVANEEGTAAHGHVGGTLDRPGPLPEGHEIAGASSSGDAESGSKGSAVGAPPPSTAPLPSAEPPARLFGDDPPAAGDPWRNAA